jgi:hypothetical protein
MSWFRSPRAGERYAERYTERLEGGGLYERVLIVDGER